MIHLEIIGTGKEIKKYIMPLLKMGLKVSKLNYGHHYILDGKKAIKYNTEWLIISGDKAQLGIDTITKMGAKIVTSYNHTGL